ncbi:MAG TPA: hypothetical protein VKB49_19205 [Candidatus Sulfotelmatobacter sp.]|nr:hypothetical protein [Candidatus Sulfotelmatobacter sp.]
MQNTRNLTRFASVILLLFLASCSINVKKEKNGQDKQVDINTLVGGIHVSKAANPEDVGIAIYPGAKLKEKDSGDDKSANVNISGFGYGLKVVALEYESNDAPDKVLAFYRGQLKKYGNVVECHTGSLHVKTEIKKHDDGSHELTCDGDGGRDIELKVGTEENQHIVAVEPSGSGANFSLVYVRTHGKEADI